MSQKDLAAKLMIPAKTIQVGSLGLDTSREGGNRDIAVLLCNARSEKFLVPRISVYMCVLPSYNLISLCSKDDQSLRWFRWDHIRACIGNMFASDRWCYSSSVRCACLEVRMSAQTFDVGWAQVMDVDSGSNFALFVPVPVCVTFGVCIMPRHKSRVCVNKDSGEYVTAQFEEEKPPCFLCGSETSSIKIGALNSL